MQFEHIDVSTYSGFKADERPMSFIRGEKTYRIQEIIDRWYERGLQPGDPSLSYFKVRADDGMGYLIRYNTLFDEWAIVVRVSRLRKASGGIYVFITKSRQVHYALL
jgi:hypothetical protein